MHFNTMPNQSMTSYRAKNGSEVDARASLEAVNLGVAELGESVRLHRASGTQL
jgi:hypothetical protein